MVTTAIAVLVSFAWASLPPIELSSLTLPAGASGDEAGRSVALSGRRLLLGVPNHDAAATNAGAAQVFRADADGSWHAEALLLAPDAAIDDSFGLAVALDGDVALVGALDDDVNGKSNAGSAHVYRRVAGTWTHEATLLASDGLASDEFGRSVAVRGDVAIVGAWQSTSGGRGAAYVFRRQPNGSWLQTQKLVAPDGAIGDFHGTSLAFDGTRLLVGAYGDDVGADTNQGSASVFRLEPNGTFAFEAKLVASDGLAFDELGRGTSIDDTLAVVGNWPFFGDGKGAAYVFRRKGTTWTEEAKLVAPDAATDDYFGFAVACRRDPAGDVAYAGAWADDVAGSTNRGSVWTFRRQGGAWIATGQLTAADGAGSDYFGFSLALSCELLAIGVRLDDVGTATNQGSARVWWVDDADGDGVPGLCVRAEDLDGDGDVDAADLSILLAAWGGGGDADLDGDGMVAAADLAILLAAWG